MPSSKLRLDRGGIAETLRSAKVASQVKSLGRSIASSVHLPDINGPQEAEVLVNDRTASGGRISARPAVDVTIAHPAGIRVEAKHGVLARAAAANGLQVKARRQ